MRFFEPTKIHTQSIGELMALAI